MAVPEDNVSIVVVVCTMNIKTFLSEISYISSGSIIEESFLVVRVSPWSHDSSNIDSESVTILVGKGSSSVSSSSDSMGSPVENEPLSIIPWSVVSDSESILVVANVLMPEESSVGGHS